MKRIEFAGIGGAGAYVIGNRSVQTQADAQITEKTENANLELEEGPGGLCDGVDGATDF